MEEQHPMWRCRVISLFALFILSEVPCFAHHMAVVVNKQNNISDVTSAKLAKMFRLQARKWQDGKPVRLVLHRNSSGEKLTLQRLSRMSSGELAAFMASHKDSVTMVDSDADVLNLVQATPGALGLVDVRSISSKIKVVRVDGKLPMEDGYLPH